jgi:septal ring factor EnvC (AmiA/AmiB activator)
VNHGFSTCEANCRARRANTCTLWLHFSAEENHNSSAALIEEVKKERQRLLAQIEQSRRTIEHSRQIIARIDAVLATADKK